MKSELIHSIAQGSKTDSQQVGQFLLRTLGKLHGLDDVLPLNFGHDFVDRNTLGGQVGIPAIVSDPPHAEIGEGKAFR